MKNPRLRYVKSRTPTGVRPGMEMSRVSIHARGIDIFQLSNLEDDRI